MPVRGDFAKLARVARQLRQVAGSNSLTQLNRNLAEAAIEQVREGFDSQKDPYGSAWASTQRGGRILQDTGRLRSSFAVKNVSPRGFHISASAGYGAFHQSGTRYLPPRKMVPDSGLPAEWLAEFRRVAEAFILAKLRKAIS